MKSDVAILDRITRYVLWRKGKQIRPTLVFLASKMTGDINDRSYNAASLVELLHTATLVHDDVVDDANYRRGALSIKAAWTNKIGVLLGDYLLSRGLLLALDNGDHDLLQIVSTAVKKMSEGELLQIEKSRHLDVDEKTYFRIIEDKTASLFEACTRCGAASTNSSPEIVEQMGEIGKKLGLAFQIRDDLFDFGVKDIGKPLGIDIQEKKMTLPLIHALSKAEAKTAKSIIKIVKQKKKSKKDIHHIGTFVEEHGGLEYARKKMVVLAEEAIDIISSFPDTPAKNAMIDTIGFVVVRSH